jgi:hypothetical protein
MLLRISISALAPWASDPLPAVASLSFCSAKRSAAVKIGIHLTFNGIRLLDAIESGAPHTTDNKKGSFLPNVALASQAQRDLVFSPPGPRET